MKLEPVSTLPLGTTSDTQLVRRAGPEGTSFAVFRRLPEGVEPFWPDVSPGHVLHLLEVAVLGGQRGAVFDFVPCVSLREVLDAYEASNQLPPLGLVAAVVLEASRSIATLTPPRVHGGLSTASLLLAFDGGIYVGDFGAPRPSAFSSPGRQAWTSDVFSMGAVMHSALTGFAGAYADAALDGVPLPQPSSVHPEASPQLDDVVMRAIARGADERQPDLDRFAEELDEVVTPYSRADIAALVRTLYFERIDALRALGVELQAGSAGQPATDSTSPVLQAVRSESIPQETQPHVDGIPGLDALRAQENIPQETQPAVRVSLTPSPAVFLDEADEPTAIRAKPAASVPRAPPAASAPRPPPMFEPSAVDVPENVTEEERRAARGQERIATPPLGAPALGDESVAQEPTNVKKRPQLPPVLTPKAEAGAPPDWDQAPRRGGGARLAIAVLLVLVAGGAGAVALLMPEKLQEAKVRLGLAQPPAPVDDEVLAVEPPPVDGADAGGEAPDGGDMLTALTPADGVDDGGFDESDGGEEFDESDGGEEEEDAVDGGTSDAGTVDGGGETPVKKKPVKKKRRKRRRLR